MMKLEDCKVVFAAVGLIGFLLFASPALSLVVRFPSGEKFSELWVLGPGHMAEDYPFNVRENESYLVYLGVDNHLSSSAYYEVIVKYANESELLPNSTSGVASPLEPLVEYRVFLEDGQTWEAPLTFSFSNVTFGENTSLVGDLKVNDVVVNVRKLASWDDVNKGYCYQLFAELWLFNTDSDMFQFNERFVGIWLNMTETI
jgi:hypothetical protein